MALINCPECNKSISDSVTICPNCGYNVRSYLLAEQNKKKQEYLKQKNTDRKKQIMHELKNNPNVQAHVVSSVKEGVGKERIKLIISLLLAIVYTVFCICGVDIIDDYPAWSWIFAVIMWIAAIIMFNSYREAKEKLYLSENNLEWCAQWIFGNNTDYSKIEYPSELTRIKPEPVSHQVRCPKCSSTQITAGQRGYNLMWGFIGSNKTMNRCANCGYKWEPKR